MSAISASRAEETESSIDSKALETDSGRSLKHVYKSRTETRTEGRFPLFSDYADEFT